MRMIDFEYDGIRLSSFDLRVGGFGESDDSGEIGNILAMSEVRPSNADNYYAVGTQYEGAFTTTFTVVKASCADNDFYIYDDTVNEIMRWLNRKEYHKFIPIYSEGEYINAYYMSTFNVQLVLFNGRIIGLTLTIMCDAPYGYQDDVVRTLNVQAGTTYYLDDMSDEIGYRYCNMEINIGASGKLQITNTQEPRYVVELANCTNGEKVTLLGASKVITASVSTHKIYNDFNFKFPRFCNTASNRRNGWKFTLPCAVKITYTPIRKVALVV